MVAIVLAVLIVFSRSLSAFRFAAGVRIRETRAMNNAKLLVLACKQYSIGNVGNFPPSLDAFIPTYLPNHSILPAATFAPFY